MAEYSNEFHIFFATMRKRFNKAMSEALSPFGLNGMHAMFLKVLRDMPGMTMKELSDNLRCNKANTSRAIAELKAKGFVCDDRKTAGSKKFRLFLTDSGKEVNETIIKKLDAFHSSVLGKLTAEEQAEFIGLAKKLLS